MFSRPRIALNAHLLAGESSYRTAGIHGYLYNMLYLLPEAASDMDFTVFTGRGDVPAHKQVDVQRSHLPTVNPLGRIVWEQAVAPFELARLKPALFHGLAFSLPLLWRGASVVTLFDLSFLRHPNRLTASRRFYLSLITRFSARRASRVIVISHHSKLEAQSLLGLDPSRIDVAVPGVSKDFFIRSQDEISAFRGEKGLPERFILYVGTLEPRKNLETLVKAYAELPQRGQIKLVLAGAKGWQTESLFQLIEDLGLVRDVILPGYVGPETLPLWYSTAEIFVYPSLYEGFGLPVLEAMACGLPVIASNTSSLPEIVGVDAMLLEPTDVRAWADAISAMLSNPDLRKDLSARGRERALEFTWERTAQQIVKSYRAVLDHQETMRNGA